MPTTEQCEVWNQTFLQDQDWNLQMAISHHGLHQSLPSLQNQCFKHFRLDGGNGCPATNKRRHHRNWPGVEGDCKIQSFEEYFLEECSEYCPSKGKKKVGKERTQLDLL